MRERIIVYTDATGKGVAAAVILFLDQNRLEVWRSEIPAVSNEFFKHRRQQVGGYELLAAVAAVVDVAAGFPGAEIRLFVDNEAARIGLVKGASPQADYNALIDAFWDACLQGRVSVRIPRVPSKSNPADGPTRLDEAGKGYTYLRAAREQFSEYRERSPPCELDVSILAEGWL